YRHCYFLSKILPFLRPEISTFVFLRTLITFSDLSGFIIIILLSLITFMGRPRAVETLIAFDEAIFADFKSILSSELSEVKLEFFISDEFPKNKENISKSVNNKASISSSLYSENFFNP